MGVAHTEALRRLGLDVVGIVGRRRSGRGPRRRPRRCRRWSTASRSCSPTRPSTAVHVTSPNHLHAEHVRAALAAGKHVVCEKPLGVSAAETADLLARAEAAGVVHAVCFNIRYYAQNQNAAALVAAGGDRRAAVRHRALPPGLAAARHRLELAPRQLPPGRVAGRRRHRLALARPRPLRHRPPRRRGLRRPAHVRDRAQPPRRRGRDVRRRRRRRRAGARAHGERRRRRAAAALRGRPARDVHGQPDLGRAQEHHRVGARRLVGRAGVGVGGSRSGCGSVTAAGPTSSSRRTRRS